MTFQRTSPLFSLALAAIAPAAAHAQECRFEAPREATLAASASETLELVTGAGLLRVEGREGLTEVRVRGTACASSEEILEALRFETSRGSRGPRLQVAEIDNSDWNWRGVDRYQARLDLVIEVPAGMAVDIDDGSGEIELRGLGDIRIDDGSGEIDIEDIDGDIAIDDGSGEVRVARVRGDVELNDGSGSVTIEEITGSVVVRDGSGSIRIAGIGGSVRIPDDGTGGVDVRDVRGDLVVRDKGNGSVRYADIDGRVDVPERNRRRRS